MKKLGLAMLVALFGLSALVTACKKQEQPAPAPTEQAKPEATTAAPAAPAPAAPGAPAAPAQK